MTTIETIYNIYRTNYKLTTDSRAVETGMVYLALRGERFDGNQFAKQALDNGASLVIVDNADFYVEDERMVLVEDGLQTLQRLATYHREMLNIPVIALTGSNGKTTTKELMNAALGTKYLLHVTAGNYNNHIGVPLTILAAAPEHELMILEMGANHQGEIRDLCSIGKPDVGLITNIGKAHLEGFGGIEGVIKGKSEMYQYLKETGGTILYNGDDDLLTRLLNNYMPSIRYSPTADFDVVDSHPVLTFYHSDILYNTHLVGSYNMVNVATAIAVGQLMECDTLQMLDAIGKYLPSNNRSQAYTKNGNHFILDAYNANPTSMRLAIDGFIKADYKNKILILGDMLELGGESDLEHRNILISLNDHQWNQVYLVGSCFMRHQSEFRDYQFFDSVNDLKAIIQNLDQHHNILVKGSRGTQLEKVIQCID